MDNTPTFKEAFSFWIKLGFISFGGPAGQIAIMHEFLVEKKKWISESKFLHALNYCMILPGPEAQQLATYIGWLLHGTRGGLAAGIMFVLPSMFILLGLSVIYVRFGHIPWIYSLFSGLKPAVIAIVILALIKIGKKSLAGSYHLFVALAAFSCIFLFNVPFPLIILGAIILATISRYFRSSKDKEGSHPNDKNQTDEGLSLANNGKWITNTGINSLRLLRQVFTGFMLWALPLLGFFILSPHFGFWKSLIIFFTKAAFVTFGGAYAVLPYVAQVSVEKFNWLTNLEMIDGLALGETTPGPLIMVLVFVGFMAGYNQFGNSILMGTIGLATTAFYTFLPCFLFIFVGAPLIEKTANNVRIKETLSIVTAAVVGVVLNLTIYLGKAVVFPGGPSISGLDYIALGWIVISFIAMHQFKIGMIPCIFLSAGFGLIHFLLTNCMQ